MVLSKKQKKSLVSELGAELAGAKSVVFSAYQGLGASQMQDLRSQLRDQDVRHKVVKITLLKRALENAGVRTSELDLSVPVSVSFSAEDEVAPAKILNEFAKKNESLQLLGGVLDKQLIGPEQVMSLAVLPSKLELRGQVVGAIAGPLRGLVGALSGNFRNLVYVLKAVEQTKS
jgi:large subunit ribosomal protein L10